jgi:HTH-type transcriptional regulator/antitoxin HipB
MLLLTSRNACYRFHIGMKAIAIMNVALRTPVEVGAAMRARRRSLGWDQAELAERIGASRLWVNQIEGGKPGAGLGLVLRAFSALGLTLSVATLNEPDAKIETPVPAKAVDLDAIVDAARKKPAS